MIRFLPSVEHGTDDTAFTVVESPVGPLTLVARAGILSAILFAHQSRPASPPVDAVEDASSLTPAIRQLDEFFRGDRRRFDLDLLPAGTPFQIEVWKALIGIPFGETRSYGELAAQIGRPAASRAVGAANGRNPIPIIIPCHRVIGASGSLTGFGGGLEAKRWLLDHESQAPLF